MPNLRKVENIHLIGTEPRCNFFESSYCRGKVKESFSCQKFKAEWDSGGSKDWSNFLPSCLARADLAQSWIDE